MHTQFSPNFNVPSGIPGAAQLRQFGSVPQVLASNNVPAVGNVTGLGPGGGAGVQIGATNGNYGSIDIIAGSNPANGGSVTLVFPGTPPTLFVAGSDGFGTITQSTSGDLIEIDWSAKLQAGRRYKINFQWATSK